MNKVNRMKAKRDFFKNEIEELKNPENNNSYDIIKINYNFLTIMKYQRNEISLKSAMDKLSVDEEEIKIRVEYLNNMNNHEVLNVLLTHLQFYRNIICDYANVIEHYRQTIDNYIVEDIEQYINFIDRCDEYQFSEKLNNCLIEISNYATASSREQLDAVIEFKLIDLYTSNIVMNEVIANRLGVKESELPNLAEKIKSLSCDEVYDLVLTQEEKLDKLIEPLKSFCQELIDQSDSNAYNPSKIIFTENIDLLLAGFKGLMKCNKD